MHAVRDTPSTSPAAAVLWTPWGPQKPVERDAQRNAVRKLMIAVERLVPETPNASVQ